MDSKQWRASAAGRLMVVPLALALAAVGCGTSTTTGAGGNASPTAKLAGTLNASGATFPQAFYEEAINDFTTDNPDVTINYGGGGSGKGRIDLKNKLMDFVGSDAPIKAEELPTYPAKVLYFPSVAGPITVSYNIKDVKTLKLTPELVAKIFQRDIKKWDDPAVKAANPGVTFPPADITVAHRSDGSGTTENFTKYLVAAAPSVWKLSSGSTITWPADTQGGQGNPGVATIVKDTPGAIGYVDLSDAKATGLQIAEIQNKAGKYVAPTPAGASAAVAGTKVNEDLTYNPLNAGGDAAYPITSPTWILTYEAQGDATRAEVLKAFLRFVLTDAQDLAGGLNYAPLPNALADRAIEQIDKITASGAAPAASSSS